MKAPPRTGIFTALILLAVLCLIPRPAAAIGQTNYVEFSALSDSFCLAQKKSSAAIWVDAQDFPGVIRAAGDLQTDVARVTRQRPRMLSAESPLENSLVLIGTIGKSALIDRLIREHKMDVTGIKGQWESFLIQVVPHPLPGVTNALVICGSDKRGTIYGIYDVSEQIGVSPWHYWADVPATHHDALFVKAGRFVQGPPAVKYRGIFLNDEWPDLSNWIGAQYGQVPPRQQPPVPPGVANYNHQFYTNIFELILRLKGNYLWPAMWNNAFNEDDPENPRLADEYGIVMGSSHQEPMLRAQKEWDRRYKNTLGSWNYAKFPEVLENFWRAGIRRNRNYESILTLGLRGADDTEMAPGGPATNQALLEKIVAQQRELIAAEINPEVTQVPQLWCLYKEVMDYYQAGMRVPDDVTLLWAEDNWGNLRRLPTPAERERSGGAGIYYHFDYHGSPRNYQWLNTSPIAKIWDQMSLAKAYGADRIWIVNVGHFKGYELPLEFFLSLARDTGRWTNENLDEFTRQWAERAFGAAYADDIADILARYTKYNGRHKPEQLAPDTYSLVNYQEAETVVADFQAIAARAKKIYYQLPHERRDAFYQLVLFPTQASALVNELYLAAGRNALFAQQGRASANNYAAETRRLFQADTNLMAYYNHTFAGGKWNHFMDQPHLGYTGWNQPPENSLRAIPLQELTAPTPAGLGVAVEGSTAAWPGATNEPALPAFDRFAQQRHYLEVFNRGKTAFKFTATASEPWICLSQTAGRVKKDCRLWISVDWSRAPQGTASGTVLLKGAGSEVTVNIQAFNPTIPTGALPGDFMESEGFVAIEPEHFTRYTAAGLGQWIKIEDYGRTLSGLRADLPANAPSATPEMDAASLEYRLNLFNTGTVQVITIAAPTLNFVPGRALRLAVAFDDEPPQVITLVPADYQAQNGNHDWEKVVGDNARYVSSTHTLPRPGPHVLKYWLVDAGVVLQKILVDAGGLRPSYLGPPESPRLGLPPPPAP